MWINNTFFHGFKTQVILFTILISNIPKTERTKKWTNLSLPIYLLVRTTIHPQNTGNVLNLIPRCKSWLKAKLLLSKYLLMQRQKKLTLNWRRLLVEVEMSMPLRFQLICRGLSPMTTHFMVGPSSLTLAVWVDPVCSMANVGGTEKRTG